MSNETGEKVISGTFSSDEQKQEAFMRRISIKSTTVQKMKKISSLFGDEMGNDIKEADMISFFLEISFETFLRSGEVEKRLKLLTEL